MVKRIECNGSTIEFQVVEEKQWPTIEFQVIKEKQLSIIEFYRAQSSVF